MGTSFHRLVMAAMAAGLLVIPGCGAGDGKAPTGSNTPVQDPPAATAAVQPTIVSAAIDGTGSLKVSFSEPMAPAEGVDPAKFRLTLGYYRAPAKYSGSNGYYTGKYGYNGGNAGKYTYTGGTAGKYTYTGGNSGKGKLTYAGGKYGGTYGSAYAGYAAPDHTVYSDVGPVGGIKVDPATGTFAELSLGQGFEVSSLCQEISAHIAANPNSHAGLYLHYTATGTPTMEGAQGGSLDSLAAYWSTDPTVEQVNGDFVGKPIPVSLTCP
ncbi:MAG TPA: hypothetical protein VGG39_15945 [Polyangiaceae bacterium]|jgi:hypothetical protein